MQLELPPEAEAARAADRQFLDQTLGALGEFAARWKVSLYEALFADSRGATLNARAVMNGVMSTEVELILAERSGIDTRALARFDKMRAAIDAGLAWLERHADAFPAQPSYLAFHLVAMWDHLALYGPCPLDYPRLHAIVARTGQLSLVAANRPA